MQEAKHKEFTIIGKLKRGIAMSLEEFDGAIDSSADSVIGEMYPQKRNINLGPRQRAVCEQLYLAKDPVSMLEISEATGLSMRHVMITVEQLKAMDIEIREISNYGAISYFMPRRIKEFQAKTNCFGFSRNK